MSDFKDRLQELLDEYELSRLELSKRIGIAASTINGYFNQNLYPKPKIAIKLADYFSCSLDYLFGISNQINQNYTLNADNFAKNFIGNFKSLKTSTKLPNVKLMKAVKMGEQTYYDWCRGASPKMVNIVAVAKYFDVSIDWLLSDNK